MSAIDKQIRIIEDRRSQGQERDQHNADKGISDETEMAYMKAVNDIESAFADIQNKNINEFTVKITANNVPLNTLSIWKVPLKMIIEDCVAKHIGKPIIGIAAWHGGSYDGYYPYLTLQISFTNHQASEGFRIGYYYRNLIDMM